VSQEDFLKVVIGLTSAFAGWLLAQMTSALRTLVQRRKLKRLLLEELKDIRREAERVMNFFWRELQLVGAGGIGNASAIGISNPIYRNYYKDALLGLNQNQRISFQMIHSLVEGLNGELTELRTFTNAIQQEHNQTGLTENVKKLGVAWGDKIKAGHHNCAALHWHVRYHLDHPRNPDLAPRTSAHENYCKYLEGAQAEAAKMVESGKSIEPGKFNKMYDPDAFKPAP
jgi:hypothetical protein